MARRTKWEWNGKQTEETERRGVHPLCGGGNGAKLMGLQWVGLTAAEERRKSIKQINEDAKWHFQLPRAALKRPTTKTVAFSFSLSLTVTLHCSISPKGKQKVLRRQVLLMVVLLLLDYANCECNNQVGTIRTTTAPLTGWEERVTEETKE